MGENNKNNPGYFDSDNNYSQQTTVRFDSNLSKDGFQISDDKALLIFKEFSSKRKCASWTGTLFGIFFTSLVTLLTANFKDVFNIPYSSYTVFGVFLALCIISGLSFIVTLVFYIYSLSKYNDNNFISACHNKQVIPRKKKIPID